jgi:hypothetical protein
MKIFPAVLVSAVLLAILVAGGCKKDESPPPPNNASPPPASGSLDSGPRAAAKNMYSLLFDGTKAQFLSCFWGTEPDLKSVGTLFDFNRSSLDFRNAFIQAYGKAAWPSGRNGPDDPAREQQARLNEIERSDLKIDGDQATLTNIMRGAEKQNPMELIKTGGTWKVKASSLRPTGPNGDKALAAMAGMASLMSKYQRAVGKPGIKPEDILYELKRALAEEEQGPSTAPHRFDINMIK